MLGIAASSGTEQEIRDINCEPAAPTASYSQAAGSAAGSSAGSGWDDGHMDDL